MLTIGYIGNGKSTNRYHLPYVLQRQDTIKVKTIFDRHMDNVIWDRIEGIHYTGNLEELLSDPAIDLIVVSVRHDLHFEYAKLVLEADKHCMVEKPFTETLAEAEELFELAETKGLHLQAFQNRRYDSDFLTVQEVIESGRLGDLLEMEMHFDYYRPEIPTSVKSYHRSQSYLYGHGCHTLDQVLSLFGTPDDLHYDVRQLLGKGRMNDYFDLDLYYGTLKVSVKSSYFRVKSRPSFVVYGSKGTFIKEKKDRQEEDLKKFYLPGNSGFGVDSVEDYGTLTYYDDEGMYHEERVISEVGDYGRVYDDLYEVIKNNEDPVITKDQTLQLMEILETGIKGLE